MTTSRSVATFNKRHESIASNSSGRVHYSPTFKRQTPQIHIVDGGHTESQVTMSKIAGEYVSQTSKQMEPVIPIYERRVEDYFDGTIFLTNGSMESKSNL